MDRFLECCCSPKVIKEFLYKMADKKKIKTILVANHWISIPKSPYLSFQKVEKGLDIADMHIVKNLAKGELVITADIPLASSVIKKNAFALNPRGQFYDEENIGEKLSMRNLLTELRDSGEITGGPAAFGQKEKQNFANAFDRFITRHIQQRN